MRTTIVAAAIAAATLCAGVAHADEAPLRVLKARVKLPERVRKHRVLMKGEFSPGARLRHRILDETSVECLLAGVGLLEQGADQVRLRKTGPERWVYKARVAHGKVRVDLNLAAGTFKLKAKGIDVSALRTNGPNDVDVALCILEREFLVTLDFDVRPNRWQYRFRVSGPPTGGQPGGDPGGDPGGGGSGGGAGTGPAVTELAHGFWGGPYTVQTQVITSASGLASIWSQWGAMGSPPSVDFSKRTVVAICIGVRATGGYTVAVTGSSVQGNDRLVTYQEAQPGPNCGVTSALSTPWVIASVPRVSGNVTFSAQSVKTRNCP